MVHRDDSFNRICHSGVSLLGLKAFVSRTLVCAVSLFALATALPQFHITPISSAWAQSQNEALTQALFLAIENQDLNGVKSAIQNGADVESRDFTGTQPVDLAINRGFFNIAHYLISVRNAKQAALSGTPVLPAPTVEELAQKQQTPSDPEGTSELDALLEDPFSVDSTSAQEAASAPVIDPFSTEQAAGDLPVLGEIQEPETTLLDEMAADQEADIIKMEEPPALTEAQAPQDQKPEPVEPQMVEDVVEETAPKSENTPVAKAAPTPEPEPETVELSIEPENVAEAVTPPKPEKPSAAYTFITTFMNFFDPPNVTGVVRKERSQTTQTDSVSEEELARQLQEIEAERGDDIIKGPAVPISPDELAQQLPPSPDIPDLAPEEIASLPSSGQELPAYSVSSPSANFPPPSSDAFGDLSITDADDDDIDVPRATSISKGKAPNFKEAPGVAGKPYDESKPFGGGVDPEILSLLGLHLRTAQELTGNETKEELEELKHLAELHNVPHVVSSKEAENALLDETGDDSPAVDDNPFDLLEGAEEPEVADLLKGLDEPQDVAVLEAKSPPAPGDANDDPFADVANDDPFADLSDTTSEGEVDELAGLLESTNEDVDGSQGWDVKQVDGANIPDEVFVLSNVEPTGKVLDNVDLALGLDTMVGKEIGSDRLRLMDQDTIHRPCLKKGGDNTLFCTDKINWPFELEEHFLVDTIMYQGTRAISRYEAGRASNYHTLFRSNAFESIIGYYTERYGQPTTKMDRAIAPLAAPRQENPTFLWQSREAGTDTVVSLEIRKFNDAQGGGFPDTKRGVIMLYRTHAKQIFPLLSQLELMVLKNEGLETAATPSVNDTPSGGDPASIW
ncbi:MAG: hypothetical protein OQK24_08685 [Magnetovibrio sp.]|nr:hypothetical protein [Magnetovibrio sp.]